MKMLHSICLLCVIGTTTTLFTSCGSSVSGSGGIYDPGYGPFDKKGNYLEAEADKPAKQKRRPSYQGSSSSSAAVTKTKRVEPVKSSSTTPTKTTLVKKTPPAPKPYVAPKPAPVVVSKPAPKPYVAPKPKPKVVSTPKPAPKPKPKPKPAPKPKSLNHKVVKGDTLYSLSRQYGTSVSAIQKANGLKSTIIALGTSLKIPK